MSQYQETTKRAILYIYTEDIELREKYAKRSNYTSDAGIDLYCPQKMFIECGSLANKIDLNIKCVLRDSQNYDTSHTYFLVPRSSIIKTPLRLSNSLGIIDCSYRGNIIAVVDNIEQSNQSGHTIEKHERLFQIVAPWAGELCVKVVNTIDDLGTTERGSNGFGSTGQ